ncbi:MULTISPECIES: hypothetical protein [unclassified Oceanobacillus]
MKRLIYKLLRISNDMNAIRRGKIGKRLGRRLLGKITGKGIGRLFK